MSNPFLDKHFPINWHLLTPQAALHDLPVALDQADRIIQSIIDLNDADLTFDRTFGSLEQARQVVSQPWALVEHLKSVQDSPELRRVYAQLLPQITAFQTALFLNKPLFERLSQAADAFDYRQLSPIQKRLVEETQADFRQQGVHLAPAQQERLKEIAQALALQSQKFNENYLDAIAAWTYTITDEHLLAGLPDFAIQAAAHTAEQKGLREGQAAWSFTLQAPSYTAVMMYLDSDAIRKIFWEAMHAVGRTKPWNNYPVIQEILKLRSEMAKILGYAHFADYTTQRRMAKNGANALQFIEDLHHRIHPFFVQEVKDLEAFRAQTLKLDEPIDPWSLAYWAEKYRKAQFDFDETALKPYFNEQQVLAGLFSLSQALFGIYIQPELLDAPHKWDPQVDCFSVKDEQTHRLLGYFYTDWFPRDHKRSGAWMVNLRTGEDELSTGYLSAHIGSIHGNFTPPVGEAKALLTHQEVQTIFHEFGHLLHHLLSEVRIPSLGGVNVAWDFVEFPSQLMENSCWQRQSLDRFAKHHQTHEPIPEDLFQKMQAARRFMAATGRMRQLSLARLDLELHMQTPDYLDLDEKAFEDQLQACIKNYVPLLSEQNPLILPRFSHLFGDTVGYAGGYYAYQWAEVLEADAFSYFLEQPDLIVNESIGRRLRSCILSQGHTQPADVLFRAFRGKDADPEALLRRDGLAC